MSNRVSDSCNLTLLAHVQALVGATSAFGVVISALATALTATVTIALAVTVTLAVTFTVNVTVTVLVFVAIQFSPICRSVSVYPKKCTLYQRLIGETLLYKMHKNIPEYSKTTPKGFKYI